MIVKTHSYLALIAISLATGYHAMDHDVHWDFSHLNNPEAWLNSQVYNPDHESPAQLIPSSQVIDANAVEAGSNFGMWNPTYPQAGVFMNPAAVSPQVYPQFYPPALPEAQVITDSQQTLHESPQVDDTATGKTKGTSSSMPSHQLNKASTPSLKSFTTKKQSSQKLQTSTHSHSCGLSRMGLNCCGEPAPSEIFDRMGQGNRLGLLQNKGTSSLAYRNIDHNLTPTTREKFGRTDPNSNIDFIYQRNLQKAQASKIGDMFDLRFDLKCLTHDTGKSISDIALKLPAWIQDSTDLSTPLIIKEDELASLVIITRGIPLAGQPTGEEKNIPPEKNPLDQTKFLKEKWQFFAQNERVWKAYFSQKKLKNYDVYLQAFMNEDVFLNMVFFKYLFFVEMISKVVSGKDQNEDHRVVLERACKFFWKLVRLMRSGTPPKNQSIELKPLQRGILVQLATLWKFLGFWMADSRPALQNILQVSPVTHVSKTAKCFFNRLFGLMIESLTERIKSSLNIPQIKKAKKRPRE